MPAGYVSGTPVTESETFADQSFASLGFTPGTYIYTWGSGATADLLTLTGVPESATWLGGALLALLGVGAWRRRTCRA